jgi:hypothetical protein
MWPRLLALLSRLGFAWARRRIDDESRREIDDHVERLFDRFVRSGMTVTEARTAARQQFGSATCARRSSE